MQLLIFYASLSTIFRLDVSTTDRIKDLKTKIRDKTGISPSHQRLTFGNLELKDENTLQDYQIMAESPLKPVILADSDTPSPTFAPTRISPSKKFELSQSLRIPLASPDPSETLSESETPPYRFTESGWLWLAIGMAVIIVALMVVIVVMLCRMCLHRRRNDYNDYNDENEIKNEMIDDEVV
jgi:hypothetical protein